MRSLVLLVGATLTRTSRLLVLLPARPFRASRDQSGHYRKGGSLQHRGSRPHQSSRALTSAHAENRGKGQKSQPARAFSRYFLHLFHGRRGSVRGSRAVEGPGSGRVGIASKGTTMSLVAGACPRTGNPAPRRPVQGNSGPGRPRLANRRFPMASGRRRPRCLPAETYPQPGMG
jgi:hypothetical protein